MANHSFPIHLVDDSYCLFNDGSSMEATSGCVYCIEVTNNRPRLSTNHATYFRDLQTVIHSCTRWMYLSFLKTGSRNMSGIGQQFLYYLCIEVFDWSARIPDLTGSRNVLPGPMRNTSTRSSSRFQWLFLFYFLFSTFFYLIFPFLGWRPSIHAHPKRLVAMATDASILVNKQENRLLLLVFYLCTYSPDIFFLVSLVIEAHCVVPDN